MGRSRIKRSGKSGVLADALRIRHTRPPSTLRTQFEEIDELVQPKVLGASLRPPAKKTELAKVRRWFGAKISRDLEDWFSWHDGQREPAFVELIPETNWSALSCARALGINAFLSAPGADILPPWKPGWLPLFENGGGDHLCWDSDTGAIVTWYHDDAARPTAYKSLATLVDKMARGYRRMNKAKGIPAPSIRKWTPVKRAPSGKTLATLPMGTAFSYVAALPMGRMQFIRVKLGDDRWLECFGSGLRDALALWKELSARPPSESSGYYSDDRDTAYEKKKKNKPGNQEPVPEAEVCRVVREVGPRRRRGARNPGVRAEGAAARTPVA